MGIELDLQCGCPCGIMDFSPTANCPHVFHDYTIFLIRKPIYSYSHINPPLCVKEEHRKYEKIEKKLK